MNKYNLVIVENKQCIPFFNIQQFKQIYPNVDVHKNNPTLLYCL